MIQVGILFLEMGWPIVMLFLFTCRFMTPAQKLGAFFIFFGHNT